MTHRCHQAKQSCFLHTPHWYTSEASSSCKTAQNQPGFHKQGNEEDKNKIWRTREHG